MALLPEELHNYGLTGLSAMADLMAEILDGRAPGFILSTEFLENMDTLRGEIDAAIEDNPVALEERELQWLPRLPRTRERRRPCPSLKSGLSIPGMPLKSSRGWSLESSRKMV